MAKYGIILLEKKKAKDKKDKEKEVKEKDKALKIEVYGKENKGLLRDEINKLAKKIDAVFGFNCIDCGREYGKQIDACHFHSQGAHSSLKYHLHNIHSGRSDCNQFSNKHLSGYEKGIKERYGIDYWNMLEWLPSTIQRVDLSNREAYEKLALVRKLNRTFDTYQITDSVSARTMFNKIIGIYN